MGSNHRFDPRSIPDLERALNGPYDLDRNLASALVRLPKVDFHLCLFLIPHQYPQEIKDFINAAALLETGSFQKFWEELKETQLLNAQEKDELRIFVGDVIGQTFNTIGLQQLGELLEYDQKIVTLFAKKKGWTVIDKKVSITPAAPTSVRVHY
eukprot:GEMP01084050.1.p1 GENE.GEMP01084050.1~~GEMP01084050.1.p1  ORF type:complete len:154 (+),score=33.41 GEMP01084050.1:160-621(+)